MTCPPVLLRIRSRAPAKAAASAAFWAWRWAAISKPPSTIRPIMPSRAGKISTNNTNVCPDRRVCEPRMANLLKGDPHRRCGGEIDRHIAKNERDHRLVRGGDRHPHLVVLRIGA